MKSCYNIHAKLLLLLFSLAIFCCKKQEQTIVQTDTPAFQKVVAWLDAQKLAATDSGISKIASLKDNLIASGLRVEKFTDKENLIIIPLKNDFKTINITNQKSFTQLVLVENEAGKLRRGDIIEVLPKNQNLENVSNGLEYL